MQFSLITCAHNPEPEIFKRLIDAVAKLSVPDGMTAEWIVVDNNSTECIEDSFDFSSVAFEVFHVKENEPGLTAARLAGIAKSRYHWLIFFDDDNEPAPDYLIEANIVIEKYPQVGAWGPGRVEVVFQDSGVDKWVRTNADLFQQCNKSELRFGNEKQWQDYYPFGTGLIIRKSFANLYAERVRSQKYTMTDRKGKSLTSGGDIQMVWTAIEQGAFAGTAPGLQLKHNISKGKSSLKYLLRQQFGTASAYIKAFNQVFPGQAISVSNVTNLDVLRMLYTKYRIYFSKLNSRDFKLLIAQKMGEMNARVEASLVHQPFLLKIYMKLL